MRLLILCCLLLLAVALPSGSTRAAGGPHIVDDSEVETPGTCHVELWTTAFLNGDAYGNAAPACTMKSLPILEIGFGYQHYWDQVIKAPLFGPQFKYKFTSPQSGVGTGLGLNAGMNLTTGDLGTASLLFLVTVPVNEKINFNFNAGWSYLRYVDLQNALFYGGQFEVKVFKDWLLMTEVFGRAGGVAGGQVGLRFTPNDGNLDFDFLVASPFDSVNPKFITFGVTIRF